MATEQNTVKTGRPILPIVCICLIVVALIIGVIGYLQTKDIEEGILETCATQQDGYVELVVDQINLKANRNDEEIIEDILSTLDASSNRYWAFSRDKNMLFVKDVTETNRYKGFTAESFYDTDDASSFYQGLDADHVSHRIINFNDHRYVASGAVFEYDGQEYRLCLLTNAETILQNNSLMGAISRLWVLFAVLIALVLVVPMFLARRRDKMLKKLQEAENGNMHLAASLERLNDRLSRKEVYDTKLHVWEEETFDEFAKGIAQRNVRHATVAQVQCATPELRDGFLTRISLMLSRNVIRFACEDPCAIKLLFVDMDTEQAKAELEPLLIAGEQAANWAPLVVKDAAAVENTNEEGK